LPFWLPPRPIIENNYQLIVEDMGINKIRIPPTEIRLGCFHMVPEFQREEFLSGLRKAIHITLDYKIANVGES
jgi:hypothetical protein